MLTEASVSQLVKSSSLKSYLVYKTLFRAQIIFYFVIWNLLKEKYILDKTPFFFSSFRFSWYSAFYSS